MKSGKHDIVLIVLLDTTRTPTLTETCHGTAVYIRIGSSLRALEHFLVGQVHFCKTKNTDAKIFAAVTSDCWFKKVVRLRGLGAVLPHFCKGLV